MKLLILPCVLALAACAQPPANQQGSGPAPVPTSIGCPSGAIQNGGYCTVRAGDGETVAMLAQRVGLAPSALGAYNGLPADHRLRAGDELVVPN